MGSPLPNHKKVRRFAGAQVTLFQAHRHDAGLVEIALGEVQGGKPGLGGGFCMVTAGFGCANEFYPACFAELVAAAVIDKPKNGSYPIPFA